LAESTEACAVRNDWFAWSKLLRVVKPLSSRLFWRSKVAVACLS
jgi:hypothetical protein